MNDTHTQCNNNAIKSLKLENQRILQKSLANCSNILPDDLIQCSPNGDAGPPTKRLSGTKVDLTTNGVGQTSKPADYCQKERERAKQVRNAQTPSYNQTKPRCSVSLPLMEGPSWWVLLLSLEYTAPSLLCFCCFCCCCCCPFDHFAPM